jgi:hypothetical protein
MSATSAEQLTGDFLHDISGRHVLSDNLGSAKYWRDANGVPLPDRSLSTLRLLTIIGGGLGLDHIYLRSPVTGFIKLITFGGFGIWYLWDVLQVFLEKERVVKYGLTAPFDVPLPTLTGVGQGMITDQPTGYQTIANFPLYILSTLLGFTGFDSLIAGNVGLFIRRVFDFGIFALLARSAHNGSKAALFFAAIAGFFVFIPYFTNLWGLVTGYKNDVNYVSVLDWYMQVYNSVGSKVSGTSDGPSEVSARLQELFGYTTLNRKTIRNKFMVFDPPKSGEAAAASAAVGTGDNIFKAIFWGSPLGVTIYGIVSLVGYFVPFVGSVMDGAVEKSVLNLTLAELAMKKATEAAGSAYAAVEKAAGPALQEAQRRKEEITSQIKSVQAQAQGAVNAATQQVKAVQEQAKGAVNAATQQVKAVQEQAKGAVNAVQGGATMTREQAQELVAGFNYASVAQEAQRSPYAAAKLAQFEAAQKVLETQSGGGEALSHESKILGATIAALIIGGGIKGVIDHLIN